MTRTLNIIALVLFVVAAISGCAAKNNNPGVTGTTGMTPTSGGTTGTGTAGSTGTVPGTPATPGASSRPRPAESSNPNDSRIKDEVTNNLINAGFSQVNVDVDDGIVTLKGTVTTLEDKDRATKLVWAVANVKDVVSQLQTQQ